jgi:hypothetical protein
VYADFNRKPESRWGKQGSGGIFFGSDVLDGPFVEQIRVDLQCTEFDLRH